MDRVAIALGSNLGDRRAHLDFAVSRLRSTLANFQVSRYYETEPVGAPDAQPLFLNAAAVGDTAAPPREVLAMLLAIEQERGRERPFQNAARTLDLDLILMGNLVLNEEGLVVPHPRFRERRFVLEPLAEIAPDLVDPVTGSTMAQLLRGPGNQFLRFAGSVKRDPAIDVWMRDHPGELGAIAQRWFSIMRGCGDDVRELLHDGQPTACVGDAAFAYVDAFRDHVNVGFFRGAEIADPKGLLEGTGRFMRHVKLRPGSDVDTAALKELIETAYADIRARLNK
jgi:2-amino-4-hydroxy-6-hydroxymethyldihydropteridine diphosphokinase